MAQIRLLSCYESFFLSFRFFVVFFTLTPRASHSEHFLYFVFAPQEATPPDFHPRLNRAHLSVAPESGRLDVGGREQKLEEPFSSLFFFGHLVADVFVCEAESRPFEFFTFTFGRPLFLPLCDRPRSSDFKKTTNKENKKT